VPRITRREDEDPVPEAAQVMGELLQGDRETIQQRGKIAGEKANRHRRDTCSGFQVPSSKSEETKWSGVSPLNLEHGTWNMELFICG
jgi:hypothetical protein